MPSPFEHLALAEIVWSDIGLADHHDAFLVGSVLADVDKIAGWPRAVTHRWLPGEDVSGCLRLLHEAPQLAAHALGPRTQALIAGYLCHLTADEQWTLTIYRRYFGVHSIHRATQSGAELQWALQSLLDQQHVASETMSTTIATITACKDAEEIAGSIPGMVRGLPTAYLAMVGAQYRMKAAGDRFAETARVHQSVRHLVSGSVATQGDPPVARPASDPERLASFLRSLPQLQCDARQTVPPAAIAEFRTRALSESATITRTYLENRLLVAPEGTRPLPCYEAAARTDL